MNGRSNGAPWFDAELLGPLAELNVHCLELMRQRVRESAGQPLPRVLGELAPLWSALGDEEIGRIGLFPYALIEPCFAELAGWRATRVRDAPERGPAAAPSQLVREATAGLTREIALLGWHFARSHRRAARVLLGMDERCVELLARCSLRELQRVADVRAIEVRLRWSDRPAVWRYTLTAAVERDEAALTRAKLRGLQLLAAETLPSAQGHSSAVP